MIMLPLPLPGPFFLYHRAVSVPPLLVHRARVQGHVCCVPGDPSVFFTQYFCVITQFRAKRGIFFTHVFTQFRREAPKFFYALFFTHFRREAPKKYITQCFLRIFRREAPPILRIFCTLFRFLNSFYALYAFLVVYFQRKAPPIFTHFFYAFSPRSGGRKILRTIFTHFLWFSREARKNIYHRVTG